MIYSDLGQIHLKKLFITRMNIEWTTLKNIFYQKEKLQTKDSLELPKLQK